MCNLSLAINNIRLRVSYTNYFTLSTAKEIAETVDAVGGQLNAFTAKEHTCYYMKVLDTHLNLAVDILSDMLLESKFADEDIIKEREVVLEEIHMYEDTPDDLIHDIHLSKAWSCHPLGNNILGTDFSFDLEVRMGAGRWPVDPHRRSADARLLPLLARRLVARGGLAPVVRQAVRARLARDDRLGQDAARSAPSAERRRRHARALRRGVPDAHGR